MTSILERFDPTAADEPEDVAALAEIRAQCADLERRGDIVSADLARVDRDVDAHGARLSSIFAATPAEVRSPGAGTARLQRAAVAAASQQHQLDATAHVLRDELAAGRVAEESALRKIQARRRQVWAIEFAKMLAEAKASAEQAVAAFAVLTAARLGMAVAGVSPDALAKKLIGPGTAGRKQAMEMEAALKAKMAAEPEMETPGD